MKDRLRLIAEHSLTYAPHHVADKLHYFSDAGLDINISYESGPGGSWLAEVLARGEADIARGGVWIPMMYRGHLEDLRIFAALCHRNAQVLFTRMPSREFALHDLVGRRVMLPMAATSQWMYFRGLFQEQGVDWTKVSWLRDLETRTMLRLWRSGYADGFLTSAPLAETLLAEGHHAALDFTDTGAVPWSVYYAPRATVEAKAGPLARFTEALSRAVRWMHEAPAAEIARLIAPDFPSWDEPALERSLTRMLTKGTWNEDMRVPAAPLLRYQKMIARYGLIPSPLAHEAIVDDRSAFAPLAAAS
jgi:NitT/TauT family transport system substrate-binding protein